VQFSNTFKWCRCCTVLHPRRQLLGKKFLLTGYISSINFWRAICKQVVYSFNIHVFVTLCFIDSHNSAKLRILTKASVKSIKNQWIFLRNIFSSINYVSHPLLSTERRPATIVNRCSTSIPLHYFSKHNVTIRPHGRPVAVATYHSVYCSAVSACRSLQYKGRPP
jgi:hypothetical protein